MRSLLLFIIYCVSHFGHSSMGKVCELAPRGPQAQAKCPATQCAWDCVEHKCVQKSGVKFIFGVDFG